MAGQIVMNDQGLLRAGMQPCPFCASNDLQLRWDDAGLAIVLCRDCETCGPPREDVTEALIFWNTRRP